jgi:hypothetical protein
MPRRIRELEAQVLPRGRADAIRQFALMTGTYVLYQVVRGISGGNDAARATWNATKVIDLERALHVFVEPRIQAWATHVHWLIELADWTYVNAHFVVTFGALGFIYLRRNASFYCVRNMFMIAMAIALIGYAVYPTAPPRLMPQWGFTDSVRQFTGIDVEHGPGSALLNPYAAIPSMHVCFSLMVGATMSRLAERRWARVAWRLYPAMIAFVVIATGNHYLLDVVLGALTALVSGALAARLLGRVRPAAWAFSPATA